MNMAQGDILDQVIEDRKLLVSKECIWCAKFFSDTHTRVIFDHLRSEHGLVFGRPENLVFHQELLQLIDERIRMKRCFFCDESFSSLALYEKHIKTRKHNRINPENKEFDKFYVSNYFAQDRDEKQCDTDFSPDDKDSEAEEWSGWEEEPQKSKCLFCEETSSSGEKLFAHMNCKHKFTFEGFQLSFHEKVQITNFIRTMHETELSCSFCFTQFSKSQDLYMHLDTCIQAGQLPDRTYWNKEQFYLSKYEDTILQHLIDEDPDNEDDEGN